jgi:general secretion pathway protein N
MSRRRIITASALMLMIAAMVFMPLRTIIGGDGISARKVDGIIWDGSVRDLRVGRVSVGDVNARLHFWPLWLGRAQISFFRGDAAFATGITGAITRSFGGVSIDNVKATLPVASLFAPIPAENIEVQDFSARVTAGRCAEAVGTVRLTMANTLPGLDLTNGLLAKPRCDRGQLLIPLLSQSAMERIDIRVADDGAYTATIFLEGDRTEHATALSLAGFRPVAGGYRMVRKGRF